jgi:hypothetical protein
MEYLNNLLEKKNMPQLILVILFILYLVLGMKMPDPIANVIDTNAGKIVVCILALALFAYSNPILGILGVIVAYELIKSSSITTGSAALEKYYPTEEKKWSPFSATHQFPYTLEQEVVKKMAPVRPPNYVNTPAKFKPILDDQHDAAPVNYQGVI